MSWGRAVQSGSRARMEAMMSETVSPGKAFRPVRTSYSTQPKDQMSVFRSRAWPRVCSVLGAFSGKRGGVRQIRGRFLLRDRLGETKIQQLHFSVGCDLDVRGFQVPMDDPFVMGGFAGLSDLPPDGKRVLETETSAGEPLGEGLAGD